MSREGPSLPLPPNPPWWLRALISLTRRVTGRDTLPPRLLAWYPRGALAAGVFELAAPGARQLDGRLLAAARIVASTTAGCPFCLDMNAATWARAGLTREELRVLVAGQAPPTFSRREQTAVAYAAALSLTPVQLSGELTSALATHFSAREQVMLALAIAQVNFWSRFNQGLGVPAAGFSDATVACLWAPPRPTGATEAPPTR